MLDMNTDRCLHVTLEWTEGRDEDIESKVKLLAPNQQRVVNVLGDDISLFSCRSHKSETRGI